MRLLIQVGGTKNDIKQQVHDCFCLIYDKNCREQVLLHYFMLFWLSVRDFPRFWPLQACAFLCDVPVDQAELIARNQTGLFVILFIIHKYWSNTSVPVYFYVVLIFCNSFSPLLLGNFHSFWHFLIDNCDREAPKAMETTGACLISIK